MANTVICEKEADKVVNFICETKDGKYTAEKPDLSHVVYSRMEIQEGNANNTSMDGFGDVILYGISC
ncbi:MAG: hypothetical protein LBO71_02410 [Prevotellaceae bacterium]|jgi:hypothetical protein|nr:hypothetical protein [Prevotellaceae bacterium]